MPAQPTATVLTACPPPELVACFPGLEGQAAIVSERVVRDGLLTSTPTFRHQKLFRYTMLGREELTRDIGDVPVAALAHLDRRGIVRPGDTVSRGDVLVGKALPRIVHDLSPVEPLALDRWSVDAGNKSLVYTHRDPGIVRQVRLQADPRGCCPQCGDVPYRREHCEYCGSPLAGRCRDDLPRGSYACVEVEFAVPRTLQVGDVLEHGQGRRFVVARIVAEGEMPTFDGPAVDILIHPDAAPAALLPHVGTPEWAGRGGMLAWTKVTLLVEEKLQVRHTGAYDPITALPLTHHLAVPAGTSVTAKIAAALLCAGYAANLMELLTIKSDAEESREPLQHALEAGGHVGRVTPVAVERLEAVLQAAAFVVPIRQEPAPGVRLASPHDIRNWSFGEVKKPETTNYRTHRPDKDGLLCERTFGPATNWECACGKYRGTKYQGMICDRCGVKVTHRCVRRKRMGHIELAVPVVHPWFVGKSALLADILDMDREDLRRLVHHDAYAVSNLGETAYRVGQVIEPGEHAEATRSDEQFAADTGAEAVGRLLRQSRRPDLAALVMEALPVLPAGLRPDVYCEEPRERFISHTLTLQYQRIVKINKRLREHARLGAPGVILREQSRALQRAVELLFGDPARSFPSQRRLSRPAHNLAEELVSAARTLLEKTTDCSARGVVVPDAAVPVGSIGVPRWLAMTLFTPLLAGALRRAGHAAGIEEARGLIEREPSTPEVDAALAAALASRPVLVITEAAQTAALQMVVTAGEAVRLYPDEGRRLGLCYAGEQVALHLPLTAAAVQELRRPRPVGEVASTLFRLTPERLLAAMMQGEALELTLLDQIALGVAGFLDGQSVQLSEDWP
jgi:hypothetical protein